MHMKINFKIILFLAKVNPKTVHVCHWQTEKNLGQNHKEPLFLGVTLIFHFTSHDLKS